MARKFITQKKQTKQEMFDAVVRNAIDFIDSSLDDLNKRPKNGIVDFYTAIELFLKARLMKEHWTLIIGKPETANLQSFSVGDFHSVYLEDAAKRLKDVLGDPLPEKALNNFKALAEHRNQIVHFAHTDYSYVAGAKAGVEQVNLTSAINGNSEMSGPAPRRMQHAQDFDVVSSYTVRNDVRQFADD